MKNARNEPRAFLVSLWKISPYATDLSTKRRAALARHGNRFSFHEDRFWVDVDAFILIAVSRDIERQRSVDDRHRRKKSLAIAERTKYWTAIRFEKPCHVKAANMSGREVAIHFASFHRLDHTDFPKHLYLRINR